MGRERNGEVADPAAAGGAPEAKRTGAADAGAGEPSRVPYGAAAAPARDGTVAPPEPLSLELGLALVAMAEGQPGVDLLERIAGLREQMGEEWGVPVPRIRVCDNLRLAPSEYVLKIRGLEVGRGRGRIGGEGALVARLGELLRGHAAALLGRDQVRSLLDRLRADYPATVEEVTGVLSTGEIRRVLQRLLAEQVAIRDLPAILETLADWASVNRDTGFLVQQVRRTLARPLAEAGLGDGR